MASYHILSKIIHWLTALLILGLLFVGFYMTALDFSPYKLTVYGYHKSFGLVVLLLVIARVAWHIVKARPKPLETHTRLEQLAARAVHIFLYSALFAMPLSGWIMSSAGDFPVQFFGLDIPNLTQKNADLFNDARWVHTRFALLLFFIVGLHMLGAFKHHFIERDRTLNRMAWPSLGLKGGLILVVIAAVFYALTSPYVLKKLTSPKMQSIKTNISAVSPAINVVSSVAEWHIDLSKSTIAFDATQYGQSFAGTFQIASGHIVFDTAQLAQSKVHINIDILSIQTGSQERDTQALSSEWFDANIFPQAVFEAAQFKKIKDHHFLAQGTLTLRGIKRAIDLPFTLKAGADKDHINMTSMLTLNRLDFGVGQGVWEKTDAIGDAVQIKIMVHAQR